MTLHSSASFKVREDAELRTKGPSTAQPRQRQLHSQASVESDFLCTFGVRDVSRIGRVGPACSAHENTQLQAECQNEYFRNASPSACLDSLGVGSGSGVRVMSRQGAEWSP